MKQRRIFIMLLVLALSITAVIGASAQESEDQLSIIATTTQAYDLMTILAGDTAEIIPLMGAGVDPHLYQPTESDITAMSNADAVFYSGLHLEGQFDEVFKALGERNIRVVALSKPVKDSGFTIGGFDLSDELTNVDDPHFWFDARNWQLSVITAAEELALLDPANAELYLERAEAYNEQLTLLYAWADEAMRQIPAEQRVLVTSHDAFQYFGAAFGWRVRGLQGISTESEAGVADIQDIANFVVEHEIPVMFIESSVPPNAIRSVQEAVQAKGFEVGIGVRELYSDAMGEFGEFGGTYIGMIGENVITILQSYGVEVPEWPEELEPVPPAELLSLEG